MTTTMIIQLVGTGTKPTDKGVVALPVYKDNEVQLYDLVIDGQWQGSGRTIEHVTQLALYLTRIKKNE